MVYFWWKENLLKPQTASEYCENDCLLNFRWHFLSLSTAEFLKNSRIEIRIHFFFLKDFRKQTWNALNAKFSRQEKMRKTVIK